MHTMTYSVINDSIKYGNLRLLKSWWLELEKGGLDEAEVFSSVLVDTFCLRKEVLGKVDLQKTIYFAKRLGAPVPFDFRWNVFGPYSYELAHHSNHLVVEGLLHYSGIYNMNRELAKKYRSRLKPETTRRLKTFFEKVKQICDEKNFDRVYFIECAASLDFIRSNVSKESERKEKVFTLLEELKPRKRETFEGMREDAWDLLVGQNLV